MMLMMMSFPLTASHAAGADALHDDAPTIGHVSHGDSTHAAAQPVLPGASLMPGLVIIGVLVMFALAAVIGPIARYHAPEEAPEPAPHHDDHDAHGAAHGHAH